MIEGIQERLFSEYLAKMLATTGSFDFSMAVINMSSAVLSRGDASSSSSSSLCCAVLQ